MCKCGYDLFSGVCKSDFKIHELVDYIAKSKAHKLDEGEDKDKDEDADFICRNGKEIRYEPRGACNKCKVIKHIIDFDINKCTSKDCNASKLKCERCSSIVIFSGLRGHTKIVHPKVDLP